jgi:hypothetical protein
MSLHSLSSLILVDLDDYAYFLLYWALLAVLLHNVCFSYEYIMQHMSHMIFHTPQQYKKNILESLRFYGDGFLIGVSI